MAIYKLNTQINSGKFKGEKVSDLIKSSDGIQYLINLHNGKYNVKLNSDVLSSIQDKIVYLKNGNLLNKSDININIIFREHCPFKNEPCNYFNRGWYDRCASCKDNNGFIRKSEDKSMPF
jgi:hypothetical protein